jgi:hypothetical protein
MQKLLFVLILLCSSLFTSLNAKTKELDLLAHGRKLTYKISFKGEEYEYIVRIKKDGKGTSFDYNISGGSSILSGFVSYKVNFKYTAAEGIAIPGFSGTGAFEPYILIDFNVNNAITKAKYTDSIALKVNKENYMLTKGGSDGFNVGNDNDVRALYCSLIQNEASGELVLGTGINKGLILDINFGNKFKMRLVKVE